MTDKQPRKQWASPEERKAHYAKQYQQRLAKEESPQGERWREKRREDSRRARAKKRAAREAAKPVKKPVKFQPSVRKAFDTPIAPRALSVIEMPVAKPVLMTSQEWEAKGGKVERLP